MIRLKVEDMTCGHCAATIARAVREVDLRGRFEIDLAAKTVQISSDQPTEEFVAAIREAGYSPVC